MTPAERAAASARIAAVASAQLDGLVAGDAIALYAAKGSEVDPAALDAAARARGLVVAYPRVVPAQRELELAAASLDELVPAKFELREPAAAATRIAVADIKVFFVPGVAFDRAGGRIGWGRGHYDATLALAAPTARRVGLAFECQLVARVDHDAHDVPMHTIITEVATHVVA